MNDSISRQDDQLKSPCTNLIDRSLINTTLIWVTEVIKEYNHLNKPLHSPSRDYD